VSNLESFAIEKEGTSHWIIILKFRSLGESMSSGIGEKLKTILEIEFRSELK